MRPARWCASCASGAKLGLLYGQGGFVTKHHGLVLSRERRARRSSRTPACRPRPTATSARCPSSSTEASGKGKVESFTVIYRGNGEVEHGVVMLRTEDGRRTLARMPAQRHATLAHLRNMDRTPVGSLGDITMADDGVPEWRVG